MRISSSSRKKVSVNMIPLMDSMFLLLVFFIYAMMNMVVQQGVPMTLPKAVSAVVTQEKILTISISEKGVYYLNRDSVALEDLRQSLIDYKSKTDDPKVYIKADQDAKHGMVLLVLDLLRQLEIVKVSFETEPQDS